MKVKELELNQEVIINGFSYNYKGVEKVKTIQSGAEQKIVFERNNGDSYDYKYFNITVGNKELKEINGQIELK